MLEVADILRRYGDGYLQKFGNKMLPSQHRAFADILNCRTAIMGGHIYQCDQCGHQHYAYHSCRNRSCPKCHKNDTAAWLEQRRQELLNSQYYHVVFTLPEQLRRVVRLYQKTLYKILMKAAAQAVIKLARDQHYVGGLIAVMSILHTSSRTLEYHPHVHCLIPAGGIASDRQQWLSARSNYLVPVKALSKVFRGIFTDMVRSTLPHLELPVSVRHKDWLVYCKPTLQGPDKVLNYLARYVHRGAIANSRIIAIEDGKVTFRYKPVKSSESKTMTLISHEFIRRFLQHVLPKGVHKVRYYGLWAPANRQYLAKMQGLLADDNNSDVPALQPQHPDTIKSQLTPLPQLKCPRCKTGTLVWLERIPRQGRAPP